MRVFIWPQFGKESGQGGIKRVYEALIRHLPRLGIEVVKSPQEADVINIHADSFDTDKPVAYSCHGLYWEGAEWESWAYQANMKIISAMHRANTKAVSVPSLFVYQALARGMLLRPFILYHGVEIEEWPVGGNGGYVGWFKTRPDPICDPDVVGIVASLLPHRKFISTFGNPGENITTLGKLPYPQIKPYIQNAGVYLATVMETGGITILESMASGVPPVGFRWGVNEEIIVHKENGYLVEPGDYEGLAEGIEYAFKHRKRLGAAARQTVVERFLWEDRVKDYIPFFSAALQSPEGPKVSVIITAYNLEQYLPSAIESVLSQTYRDWELIIVDDCSPDRCGAIAEHYAAQDKRIRVIHNPQNVYLAEARNIGIRASRGEYIIPLDADDQLAPRALEILVRALDENKDIDIVTGAMQVIDPDGSSFVSSWPWDSLSFAHQISKKNMLPYASMYRRWVWEHTGGYRRRMRSAEDAEFWTRAMSFGAVPAKVTTYPTLIYTNRPTSMSHTEQEPDWTQWFIWSKIPSLAPCGAFIHFPQAQKVPVKSYHPPKISVIIPVGPGHDIYLQDALDSLLAQTFQDWEVIVVNDTGERWLDEAGNSQNPYWAGFPFARLIDSEHPYPKGVAWARNRGIREAKAPLFVLLDADDYMQPLLLEKLYNAYKEVGGWIYPDFYDQEGNYKRSREWDARSFITKMLGPSTGLYAKRDWELVGGFDESVPGWEDYDFQLSLFEHGICGSRLPYAGFTYRYDTGSRRDRDFSKRHILVEYIRRKHKGLYEEDLFMACRSCGGGGGKRIVPSRELTQQDTGQDMVLVEYIGPEIQFQRVRSFVEPGRSYRFGGPPGSDSRKFFVYASEAHRFERNSNFRILKAMPTQNGSTPKEDIVLRADRTPLTRGGQRSVDSLGLSVRLANILKKAGYKTVDDLRRASDAELLSLKGVGAESLRSIRDATARV